MVRVRDPEGTRRRVIDAAAKEFAMKGYDGSTLSGVARRARVSKQLISHHFGSKAALFLHVHEEKFRPAQHWNESPPEDPRHLFAERFKKRASDLDYIRFLAWEAASARTRAIPAERDRQKRISEYGAAIRGLQRKGKFPPGFDYRMVQLAAFSLATYPIAFGQITRLVTGKDPTDPKFRRDWARFLEKLGEILFAE